MTYPLVNTNVDFEIGQLRPESTTTIIAVGQISNQRGDSDIADNIPKRYTGVIPALQDLASGNVVGSLWDTLIQIYTANVNCPIIAVKVEGPDNDPTPTEGVANTIAAITAANSSYVKSVTKPGHIIMVVGEVTSPAASAPNPLSDTINAALGTTTEAIGAIGIGNPIIYPVPTASNLDTIETNLLAWLAANYQNTIAFLPYLMLSGTDYGSAAGYIAGALAYADSQKRTNAYVTHLLELPPMTIPALSITPTGATGPITTTAKAQVITPGWGMERENPNMVALVNANYLGILRHNGFQLAGNEFGINPTSLRGRTSARFIGAWRYAARMQYDGDEIAFPYTGLVPSASNIQNLVRNILEHEETMAEYTEGYIESISVRLAGITNRRPSIKGRVNVGGPTEGIDLDFTFGA